MDLTSFSFSLSSPSALCGHILGHHVLMDSTFFFCKREFRSCVDSRAPLAATLLFPRFPNSVSAWPGIGSFHVFLHRFSVASGGFFIPFIPSTPGKQPLSLNSIITKPIRDRLFFTVTKTCAPKHNLDGEITCCTLPIHTCSVNRRTIPGAADPFLSFSRD